MTARTPAVGSQTSSDFLTAAEYNDAAGGLCNKVKATSDQTGITSVTPLTGLSTSCTPNTARDLKISFVVKCQNSNSGEKVQIKITKDGADLMRFDFVQGDANTDSTHTAFYIDESPSAGAHTYALEGGRSGAGSGVFQFSASVASPNYLIVEDCSPTF